MTPQQNSKINNEHLKSTNTQKINSFSSNIKGLIEKAKNHVNRSSMDALYNIKDTKIHGKENKQSAFLDKIKCEFLLKNLGENNIKLVNDFNLAADNIMNKSDMKFSNYQLQNFNNNLKTIKNDVSPEAYEAIKSKLNKLM